MVVDEIQVGKPTVADQIPLDYQAPGELKKLNFEYELHSSKLDQEGCQEMMPGHDVTPVIVYVPDVLQYLTSEACYFELESPCGVRAAVERLVQPPRVAFAAVKQGQVPSCSWTFVRKILGR